VHWEELSLLISFVISAELRLNIEGKSSSPPKSDQIYGQVFSGCWHVMSIWHIECHLYLIKNGHQCTTTTSNVKFLICIDELIYNCSKIFVLNLFFLSKLHIEF
jgi:hypothetical protein